MNLLTKFIVKKVIPLVFALSICAGPSLSWGWGGEGGCSYSKEKSNEDAKPEQVEEIDAWVDW